MKRPFVPRPGRPGLALPAAIFTLAVVTLFIAGSAFAAMQEANAASGSLAQRLALEAAEYGAAAVIRDWDRGWNTATPVGATLAFAHSLPGGAASRVRLTRTGSLTWWLVSTGSAGGTVARREALRTVNAALRLDVGADSVVAALSAADSVHVTGTGMVIGADSAESLAACGMVVSPVAGVASPDTTRTCDGTCGS